MKERKRRRGKKMIRFDEKKITREFHSLIIEEEVEESEKGEKE